MIPYIAKALLNSYGRKATCLSFVSTGFASCLSDGHLTRLPYMQAVVYTVFLSCAVPFIKPRLPLPRRQKHAGTFPMRLRRHRKRSHSDPSHSEAAVEATTSKWRCVKSSAFWLLCCGVFLQGLGSFVPGTYLPCESVLFAEI